MRHVTHYGKGGVQVVDLDIETPATMGIAPATISTTTPDRRTGEIPEVRAPDREDPEHQGLKDVGNEPDAMTSGTLDPNPAKRTRSSISSNKFLPNSVSRPSGFSR
jgi:hypothetical protein